jgi:mono/diheme cytochrome c family protein
MSSPIRAEEVKDVRRFIGAVALAAFCGGAIAIPARAQEAPHGDAANGKRLYIANYCYTCHGRVGQGGAYNGPAPALAKTAMPYEGLVGQTRNPSNDMPAYAAQVLPDQALADIYAYLQSLPGPSDPKGVALLKD